MKRSQTNKESKIKNTNQFVCEQQHLQQQNQQENQQEFKSSAIQQSNHSTSQEHYEPRDQRKREKASTKDKKITNQQAKNQQNQIETVRYFPQKDQPFKYYDQKVVIARYFCRNKALDYDNMMRIFQKHRLNCYMNKDKYRRMLYSFINDVVRALERYLIHQLNQHFQQFRRRQLRDTLPFLLRCKNHFTSTVCQVFRNFTVFVFQLSDVELQPNSLIFLHSKISELISNLKEQTYKIQKFKKINKQFQKIPLQDKNRRRIGSRKPTSMDQINQIWTDQHQRAMIDKYKQTHSFRLIKNYFSQVFPQHRFLWTKQNIGRRFQRVLRRGLIKLKKLIQYLSNIQKVVMPQLINLDHRMIKILVRRPSFINIRLMFIDLLGGKKEIDFLTELINSVNQEMKIVRDKHQIQKQHANIGKQLEYFREIEKIKL